MERQKGKINIFVENNNNIHYPKNENGWNVKAIIF